MEFRRGMWVRNLRQADWGIGEVVEVDVEKARILFSEVGEKHLVLKLATIEEVPPPENVSSVRPRFRARSNVDMVELEHLCKTFHEQFKDRRSNTDDGGMSLRVLRDMQSSGDLTRATAKRLFQWCHTGESYADGVDLAQTICSLIYGRVPTRAELEKTGLL